MSEEIKRANGVIDGPTPIRDYEYAIACGASAISDTFPKHFELNDDEIGSIVFDQGSVGACVACALSCALECAKKKTMGEEIVFSEGWAYGTLRDTWIKGYGLIIAEAINQLIKKGNVPKKVFNMLDEMPTMKEITDKFPEFIEIAKKYTIKSYFAIHNGDRTTGLRKDLEIKDSLVKYRTPLIACSPKHYGESHCILIIGWDDDTNKYKIKNSWGASYGKNGTEFINKDYISEVYLLLDEEAVLPFKDVNKSDWFYKNLKNCYYSGIVNGKSETEFDPEANVTRAELVAIIDRLMAKVDARSDAITRMIGVMKDQLIKK